MPCSTHKPLEGSVVLESDLLGRLKLVGHSDLIIIFFVILLLEIESSSVAQAGL